MSEALADDWSQDCLEYLYNNKIFFPGFVRYYKSFRTFFVRKFVENLSAFKSRVKTSIFNIKLQKRHTVWIPLLLPLIDIFTDHIFAFLNASKTNSQAVAAIGVALLFNLFFGPMIYGEIFLSNVILYISTQIVYMI